MSDEAFKFAKLDNGWLVGKFAALDELESVIHVVTTKSALDTGRIGADREGASRELASALGLNGVAYLQQVHGRRVLAAERAGLLGSADAMVTNMPGLGLMGVGADCPLILAVEPTSGAVGMAHASWRGTVGRIASELVLELASRYAVAPEDIVAAVCPSAGPCCYEVGNDVVTSAVGGIGDHAERFFQRRDGRIFMDLWAANREELLRAGVKPHNIHVAGVCTICRHDLFPSYRIEGEKAGRFAAVIAISQ